MEPRECYTRARAEPGGLRHPEPSPWAMGIQAPHASLASSAPLPTWALRSITLPRFQGALSSLSKVTPRSHAKPLVPAPRNEIPVDPRSPFPTSPHANRPPNDTGPPRPVAWVGVRRGVRVASLEAAESAIQRPDLHFTKSPRPPPQPSARPGACCPCGKPPRGEGGGGSGEMLLAPAPPAQSPSGSCQR